MPYARSGLIGPASDPLAHVPTQLMEGMQCEETIPRKFKVLDDDSKEIGGDTGLVIKGGEGKFWEYISERIYVKK